MKTRFTKQVIALLAVAMAPAVSAATFGVQRINDAPPPALVDTPASLATTIDITDGGGGMVDITINNNGPAGDPGFVITVLYIDDAAPPLLTGFDTLPQNWDDESVSPPDLPSGSNISFTAQFSADANNPKPKNGIGGGESATFMMTLTNGTTFQQFINAVQNSDTRIGLRAQSIDFGDANDASENFVSVPEPGSLALLSIGGLLMTRRRR